MGTEYKWAVGPIHRLWANINSTSDMGCINFTFITLTNDFEMDEWIHSRHRGSKGTVTNPCIFLIMPLDVRDSEKVLVESGFNILIIIFAV